MPQYSIIDAKFIAPGIKQFIIKAPLIAQKRKAGQFAIVQISERGERVPMTIVDSDASSGTITLIVQGVGKTTLEMNQLNAGDQVHYIVGPLGTPSRIENFGNVVVVGGGVGTAVSFPQVKALKEVGNHVTAVIGARTQSMVILEEDIRQIADEVLVCTDDGSYGIHGLVTDVLATLLESGKTIDYILAIGPIKMMQAVAELTRPKGILTNVSLNPIMVDGTGMCGGCRVIVGDKVKFACVDGPDFDGHQVNFENIFQRNKTYEHEEECALAAAVERLERSNHFKADQSFSKPVPRTILNGDFKEVNHGLREDQVQIEAERCLLCRNPRCVSSCPVGVKIPDFIQQINEKNYISASKIIKEDNVLAAVCSRVCPQENQCEGACILAKRGEPIAIGALARFVTDYERNHAEKYKPQHLPHQKTGKKVAVIGSGPSGLACAGDLVRMGHQVTIFEAFHSFGGVLIYGIPQFRLPKEIVHEEVSALAEMGVNFKPNTIIGKTIMLEELMTEHGFDAVFIGVGAGLPYFMNIPGENLVGIYSSNEFLTRVNLMKANKFPQYDTPMIDCHDKHVAVIGGGNTALDSVRIALRMGAEKASIIYRRTELEMPARREEIKHALEEGVEFHFLNNPVAYIGDENDWVKSMRLIKMALGEEDSSGRRRPIPIEGSEYEMPVDLVVVAIGNGVNPILQQTTKGLAFNRWGNIIVNKEDLSTSIPGVFAGGDIVTGSATVILAMGAGRRAAQSIDSYLKSEPITEKV
jgi:glutamate synthase (NADPH/NADH) small chain